MGEAIKANRMAELGKLGGKRSGESRRSFCDIEKVACKLLNLKIKYPRPLENVLREIDAPIDKRPTMLTAIYQTFLMKALGGDLKAAYFCFDVGGLSNRSKEHRAKVRLLEKMADNPDNITIEPQKDADLPIEEIRRQAKELGVYDEF